MLDKRLFVSIILPVYNEVEAISGVIADLKKMISKVPGYQYEIIVVDDGSTDKTSEKAQGSGVKVIRHPANRGSGAARKTGIRHAKGEIILMMDADGSYSVIDIHKILNYFPVFDQVIGSRVKEAGTLRPIRFLVKSFIKGLASYLTGVKIPDLNSGMRAFKKDIALKYLWLIPDGFSCVTTMTMTFLANGHQVKWVPISYKTRIGKSKFHPLKDTYNYLLTVVRMVLIYNPLKVFLPIGLALIFLAVVKGLWTFFVYGEARMLELILLMIGFFTISIGFLADLMVTLSKKGNEK
ncbi:glycosyltransferase family 2 protein [Candidatus Microgenomates bacterium]|nr:glycosyltransferase family 2 protein [Candidatus Microgenomates bacterium]